MVLVNVSAAEDNLAAPLLNRRGGMPALVVFLRLLQLVLQRSIGETRRSTIRRRDSVTDRSGAQHALALTLAARGLHQRDGRRQQEHLMALETDLPPEVSAREMIRDLPAPSTDFLPGTPSHTNAGKRVGKAFPI